MEFARVIRLRNMRDTVIFAAFLLLLIIAVVLLARSIVP
jgi:hypothetical protein